MNWRNWFRGVVVGMVALAFAFGGVSGAAAEEVSGSGSVTAQGRGTARIEGDGTVVIGRGTGVVYVTGAERILTEGRGRRTVLSDGTVRLAGYTGALTIVGEEMVVRINGGAIHFSATGEGSVILHGVGSYTVGSESGEWTKTGVTLGY